MNKRDVLQEIDSGALTPEAADEVVDAILNSQRAPDIEALLMLSRTEWTAYGQGASLAEIARWRYRGWPKRCTACGLELNVGEFGWRVVEADGDSVLKHVKCPVGTVGCS